VRLTRFKPWFSEQVATLPGVEAVEPYHVPGDSGLTDVKIVGSDGVALYLRLVRVTPSGDDESTPEKIVTRDGSQGG